MEREVKEKLDNHEGRLQDLEKNEREIFVKIENLTKSVDELVSWLKAIVIGTCASGIGFIIWYIQK